MFRARERPRAGAGRGASAVDPGEDRVFQGRPLQRDVRRLNPQNYTTADGWPGVRWVQEFPTGETVAGERRRRRWKFGVFVGLLIAILAGWSGWGLIASVAAGVLAMAVVVAPDAWRGWSLDLGTYGATRPLEPTDDERAA